MNLKILGFILFFSGKVLAQTPGMETNPLTNCDLYPSSSSLTQLNNQIQQLRVMAQTDPSCQVLLASAMSYQANVGPLMNFGMSTSPNAQLASGMSQMVNSFNNFMEMSNQGNACASTELGSQLRQSVGGTAVNIATTLAGATPFAPVIGSLVGAIAQQLFRYFQGPNLEAINNRAISNDEKAQKYACLYRNFSNLFISQCQRPVAYTGLAYERSILGGEFCYIEGIFNQGVSEAQSFANSILRITQPQTGTTLSDQTRQNLQGLQRSMRDTKIRSPDGNTEKSLADWLVDAGAYFASPGEDGYPRSAALARGLQGVVSELNSIDSLLRNIETEDSVLLESLGRLQNHFKLLQENASLVAPNLASETGTSLLALQNNADFLSLPVGTPLMNDKGLILSLMAFFQQTMPNDYTQKRQNIDILHVSRSEVQANMSLAASSLGSSLVPERDRHQSFNAVMAIVQKPIIDHMKSLQASTRAGGGRTAFSICQAHTQLAKNCATLSGVFVYSVGNSSKNELGANMISNDRMNEYQDMCGVYIEKGIIPSPFESPAMKEFSCNNGLRLTLSSSNQQACAANFQRNQCNNLRPSDIPPIMTGEFCPPGGGSAF